MGSKDLSLRNIVKEYVDSANLLTKLKKGFEEEQLDWWNDISKEEQKEIKEGLSQEDNGEVVSHKKVMDRFNKWH